MNGINWEERLKPGMPPLRPGEFAMMTGWSPETVRKMLNTDALDTVRLVEGGERRVPVRVARETAIRLEVIAA